MNWLACPITLGGNLPFQLLDGNYTVGRRHDCDIVIRDVSVSRKHALITVSRGALLIEDLDSTNGTFVDDKLVKSARCSNRSKLVLGSVRLFFVNARTVDEIDSWFEDSETYRPVGQVDLEIDSLRHLITPTHVEIVRFLVIGKSEAEIARTLKRSPVTIHNHIQEIYRRLDVHSLAELLRRIFAATSHVNGATTQISTDRRS